MAQDTDEALIGRIARRDQSAMRAFYERHHVRVYRFMLRIVKNEATAEDLLSDVFYDIWRQADRFEGRSSVVTWALSIARFKALSCVRRRKETSLEPDVETELMDPADTPEIVAQKTDKAEALRAGLARLSEDHRQIVELVYYHELSVQEVADMLQIPENTAKTRLFYARKRLSDCSRTPALIGDGHERRTFLRRHRAFAALASHGPAVERGAQPP
jgi:RNA polymerase sigma-70 factor, ECF subfamily